MAIENWERIQELFLAAADLNREDRARFLDAQCGAGSALRSEVESLLTADAETGELVLSAVEKEAQSLLGVTTTLGSRLGSYRVIRQIGRGGMGAVYLALRDDDLYQKQVAIKLIRHGMDTADVLDRFRHERQILANLDHPYIARLIDGGTSSDGRPFFVMDYVEGRPVDQFCRENALDTKARCRLFLLICEAVAYAHRNLVVHRDLKPGNILVTADGTPRLLDFGVAKLLDPTADGSATATRTTRLITPEYASPEQLRGLPVNIATDVYSLGAILFELLTGSRAHSIKARAPLKIERAAVTGMDADLANIVAMAMREEPERRYHSVDQLTADIRNYLEARPVLARKDSWWYRSRSFARRHRYALLAAASILASLLAGIVIAFSQAREAKAARDVAINERQRAEGRLTQIVSLSNLTLSDVYTLMERLPGAMPARKELLSAMLDFLEKVSKEASDDERLKFALAKAYLRLGDLQGDPDSPNIGDTAGALKSFRTASALLGPAPLEAGAPDTSERLAVWADLQNKIGKIFTEMSDRHSATDILQNAIRAVDGSAEAGNGNSLRIRATLYLSLSRATVDLPQLLQFAERSLKDALAAARQFPDDSAVQLLLSGAHTQVGFAHTRMGNPEATLGHYEESMRIRERLVRDHPNDLLFRRFLKLAYEHFAALQGGQDRLNLGHPEIARLYYKKAQPLEEADFADPQNNSAKFEYASYLFSAAAVETPREGLAESLATLRKAAALFESLGAAEPGIERYNHAIADASEYMGHRLLAMGNYSAALAQYNRALSLNERMLAKDPDNLTPFRGALHSEGGIARVLMFTGDRAGALEHANRMINRAEARRGGSSPASVGESYLVLSTVHRHFGDCDSASQAAEKSIGHIRPLITTGRHDANRKILGEDEVIMGECSSQTPRPKTGR